MRENFMARALNKNKKPETNNKNRACNYFLGSFGSPCGFWRLALALHSACYKKQPLQDIPLQALAQLPTPSPD